MLLVREKEFVGKLTSFQNFVEKNMNFPFLFTFREEQKKLSLEIHRKLPLISLTPVKSPPLTYTPPLPSLISHPPPLTGYRPISPKTKKNISVRKPSSSFSFLVLRQELSTTPVILTENLKFFAE